jgi:hypothetical protein
MGTLLETNIGVSGVGGGAGLPGGTKVELAFDLQEPAFQSDHFRQVSEWWACRPSMRRLARQGAKAAAPCQQQYEGIVVLLAASLARTRVSPTLPPLCGGVGFCVCRSRLFARFLPDQFYTQDIACWLQDVRF